MWTVQEKRKENPYYCLSLAKYFHQTHENKLFTCKYVAAKHKHVPEIPGLLNFAQCQETVWHPQGQEWSLSYTREKCTRKITGDIILLCNNDHRWLKFDKKKDYIRGVFFSLLDGVSNNKPIINWLKKMQSIRDIFFVTKSFYDSLTYSQKETAQMLREQTLILRMIIIDNHITTDNHRKKMRVYRHKTKSFNF